MDLLTIAKKIADRVEAESPAPPLTPLKIFRSM